MADPFNPAEGHLFYTPDPSNPANYFYQGPGLVNAYPHPPHPVTNFNGAPGADADDEGPTPSDEEREYSSSAAPCVPAVGRRDDDHELERRKKHTPPARSRENWLSYAALMIAQSAASTSSVSPDRARGRTDTSRGGPQQHPYPVNPYDRVTPGPHPSCPLCGTPYQRGPSVLGSPHVSGPRDVYRHEQTRDGPQLGRCPACHCPTRTQVSPTDAPTRFLSSGRREYITGYPSQSQRYPSGATTTAPYANTNRTSLPYGSPTNSYGQVTRTSTSGQGYQTDSRIWERTPTVAMTPTLTTPMATMTRHTVTMTRTATTPTVTMTRAATTPTATMTRSVTRTEPRNHALGMYDGNRSQTALPTGYLNAAIFAPASISKGRGPAPASENKFVTGTTPPVASTSLSSANVVVTSQEGQGDGADAAYSGSTNDALVSDMMIKGIIKSDDVAVVMRAVDRSHYVTDKAKAYIAVTHLTEQGIAVPAPHIHAAILESILPYIKAGSHVLDVGASTGLFAAMLYHRTGKDGVTVSLSPSNEVVDLAKQNLVADGLDQALQDGRILLVKGGEKSGYAPCAPYNVIHVTKVVEEIPPLLLTQLASPGRMVIPVRTDGHDVMIQVDKDAAGDVSQKELPDLL